MTAIELLAETSDTVTLGRRDSDALIAAVEIADDVALIDGCERAETALGRARARRDYLTDTEMQRLLDGGNRLRLWREKRGVPQGALARAIGVAASYLTEVETGSKPGSTELYQRVAAFLDLDLENLLPRDPPSGEPPMDRSDRAAFRLATRAGTGAGPEEMAAEARAIVAEWRMEADREGAASQVKAMLWRLRTLLSEQGGTELDAAIDVLSREARKL